MVLYAFNPNTKEIGQMNLYEFKSSLVYLVSSRLVKAHTETWPRQKKKKSSEVWISNFQIKQ